LDTHIKPINTKFCITSGLYKIEGELL